MDRILKTFLGLSFLGLSLSFIGFMLEAISVIDFISKTKIFDKSMKIFRKLTGREKEAEYKENQFVWLKEHFFRSYRKTYNDLNDFEPKDFYLSTPAQWYGIIEELDIRRENYKEIKEHILDNVGSRKCGSLLAFLYGTDGSGKSTLLRRLAYDLVYSDQMNEYNFWWVKGGEDEKDKLNEFIDNKLPNLKAEKNQKNIVFINGWPEKLEKNRKTEIFGGRKSHSIEHIQYVITATAKKEIKNDFYTYRINNNFFDLNKCNDNEIIANHIIKTVKPNKDLEYKRKVCLSGIKNISKLNLFVLVFIILRSLEELNGYIKNDFSSIINSDLNNLQKNQKLKPLVEIIQYYAWLNIKYNINLTKNSFFKLAQKKGFKSRTLKFNQRLRREKFGEISYYLSLSKTDNQTWIKFNHQRLANEIVNFGGYDEKNIYDFEIDELLNFMMTDLSNDKSTSIILYKMITSEDNKNLSNEQKKEWFNNLLASKNSDYHYLLLIFCYDNFEFDSNKVKDRKKRVELLFSEATKLVDKNSPFWSYCFDFLKDVVKDRKEFLDKLEELILEKKIDNYHFENELLRSSIPAEKKIKLASHFINNSTNPKIIEQSLKFLSQHDKEKELTLRKAKDSVQDSKNKNSNSNLIFISLDILLENKNADIVEKDFVFKAAKEIFEESKKDKLLIKSLEILKGKEEYLSNKYSIKKLQKIIIEYNNQKLLAESIYFLKKLNKLSDIIVKRMKDLIDKAKNQKLIYYIFKILYFERDVDNEVKVKIEIKAKEILTDKIKPELISLCLDILNESDFKKISVKKVICVITPITADDKKMPKEVIIKALEILKEISDYNVNKINELKEYLCQDEINEEDFSSFLLDKLEKPEKIYKAEHIYKTTESNLLEKKALDILERLGNIGENKRVIESEKEDDRSLALSEFKSQINNNLKEKSVDNNKLYNNLVLPKTKQGGNINIEILLVSPIGIYIIKTKFCKGKLIVSNTGKEDLKLIDEEKKTEQTLDNELYLKLCALQKQLEDDNIIEGDDIFNGCIIFPNKKELEIDIEDFSVDLINSDNLGYYFKNKSERLSPEQIYKVNNYLLKFEEGKAINRDNVYQDLLLQKELWSIQQDNKDYTTEAWLARDENALDREVQVYIYKLKDNLGKKSKQKALRHIKKNIRALDKLDHSATPDVIEYDEIDNNQFYVKIAPPKAVIEGYPLKDYLQRFKIEDKRLPLNQLISIFIQLTDALEHAHKNEVYHRGINPSNVFVSQINESDLNVGISDFSSARIQEDIKRTTSIKYAFNNGIYTPPELGFGIYYEDFSESDYVKMDVYCIGVLLFEALTLLELEDYHDLSDIDPIEDSSYFDKRLYEYFWSEYDFNIEKMFTSKDRYQNFDALKETLDVLKHDF